MATVDLPYVHQYRDRHGKLRSYYRRAGQRQPIEGEPASAEWLANYQRIHAGFEAPRADGPGPGTFGHLVTSYYASPEFRQLRASTQAEYRRHIDPAREKWQTIRLAGLSKAVIRAWRNSLADKPTKANHAIATLRTLFEWAIKYEMLKVNPAKGVEPLKEDREGWQPWPPAALERFAAKSSGATRIAFHLALYTGQRRADVLALRWDAVDLQAGEIHIRQAKTGVELWIPIHPALRAELLRERRDQAERQSKRQAKGQAAATGLTVVQKLNGAPYHEDGFGTIWNRAQHDCGCAGLPFHGLRKNATNTLFEAGATPQQVQAITGHESLEMVQLYGRGADRRRLAREAMRLWNDHDAVKKEEKEGGERGGAGGGT